MTWSGGGCATRRGPARLGRAAAVRERLAAVAAHIDGELVRARLAYTEALGADLLAAAAARRASELAARADDPVTPALHAVETRAILTPAERETAVLAANGRADKEIAEQLHLSPRTVENRLQRVYDNLGVTGRGELADALAPGG
jgi:DNA-binding NarL/FixJ family response regulator